MSTSLEADIVVERIRELLSTADNEHGRAELPARVAALRYALQQCDTVTDRVEFDVLEVMP